MTIGDCAGCRAWADETTRQRERAAAAEAEVELQRKVRAQLEGELATQRQRAISAEAGVVESQKEVRRVEARRQIEVSESSRLRDVLDAERAEFDQRIQRIEALEKTQAALLLTAQTNMRLWKDRAESLGLAVARLQAVNTHFLKAVGPELAGEIAKEAERVHALEIEVEELRPEAEQAGRWKLAAEMWRDQCERLSGVTGTPAVEKNVDFCAQYATGSVQSPVMAEREMRLRAEEALAEAEVRLREASTLEKERDGAATALYARIREYIPKFHFGFEIAAVREALDNRRAALEIQKLFDAAIADAGRHRGEAETFRRQAETLKIAVDGWKARSDARDAAIAVPYVEARRLVSEETTETMQRLEREAARARAEAKSLDDKLERIRAIADGTEDEDDGG